MKLRILIAVLLVTLAGEVITRAAEPPLKPGDMVPEFKLPYATSDTIIFEGIGSKELSGKRYLLAFYPADWSPGCTREVCRFRDSLADFEELGVEVLGVSVDNLFSHRKWAQSEKLNFKLLSDQTHKFGRAMGVYNEKSGTFARSVFVVGPDGRFEYIDYEYSIKDDRDFETLKRALAAL